MRIRVISVLLLGAPGTSDAQERLVVRAQSESALVVRIDRMLATPSARFEDLVALENLLIGAYAERLRGSGILQYRRLLLIRRAEESRSHAPEPSALAEAWVLAHSGFLADDPFSNSWYPRTEPYWRLYETHKSEPWSDDLAWSAAQIRPPGDECYADCVLQNFVIAGPLQYWSRLPTGRHLDAALAAATKDAEYAVGVACYDSGPAPREYGLLEQIRRSLAPVRAQEKQVLLAALDRIEQTCKSKERRP